ncbi:UNVERIFIED_CONTAM: hypothetical protein Slati_0233000 [Sesamum latifolium]|uniref:Uncharacterized protein n=1 Tax=Sesamum latifolium TaxID=2727402 RepID=A0AAW2YCQ2_9LAMI
MTSLQGDLVMKDLDAVTIRNTSLVNIPLQFTSEHNTVERRMLRRGRPPGRTSRGGRIKRQCGVQIIENDMALVNANKRRMHLLDDSSDSISVETASQSRRDP